MPSGFTAAGAARPPEPALTSGPALPSDETVIEGEVDTILFRNERTGYTVLGLDAPDSPIAVGTMPGLQEGEPVRLTGRWTQHPEYGPRFEVQHYETILPRKAQAIERYLSSGLIRGIGPATARKIVRRFGDDTLNVLEQEPERVATVPGIGKRKAGEFAAEMRRKKEFEALSMFLAPYGVGPNRIMRISRLYGPAAVRIIQMNPYALAEDVPEIGFLTADRIALALGVDPASAFRVASALQHVLSLAAGNGSTGVPLVQAISQAGALLGFQVEPDCEGVQRFLDSPAIRQVTLERPEGPLRVVMLTALYGTEVAVSRQVRRIAGAKPAFHPELADEQKVRALIRRNRTASGQNLSDEQNDALAAAFRHPLLIITGGPGTGKTTLVQQLCGMVESLGGMVLLAAPTGRAARRLGEATGREAKTLHRLLEIAFRPDDPSVTPLPQRNADRPLDADFILVDESSMLDVFLMNSLAAAIRPGTRLVLIGDADQLPSVGPGQVLHDLIDSGRIPVMRLTRIFRQDAGSLIVENAHRIRSGQLPRLVQSRESPFIFIARDTAADMADAAVRLVSHVLPDTYGYDFMNDVQVLSPARKGDCGVLALNELLQRTLNPPPPGQADTGRRAFRTGDRVMQTRNNYTPLEAGPAGQSVSIPAGSVTGASLTGNGSVGTGSTGSGFTGPGLTGAGHAEAALEGQAAAGIYNGETGIVESIDEETGDVIVRFEDSRLIRYDLASQDDLSLAYAITVHKSQGSEYPAVVLTIPPGAPGLLNRSILYTAVTRARRHLFLITSREILAATIRRIDTRARQTILADLLKLEPGNEELPLVALAAAREAAAHPEAAAASGHAAKPDPAARPGND